MIKAKSGDNVKTHYKGKLLDGTVFDSSEGREPLCFEIGSGSLIPGFEKGVIGMAAGDSKTITIPPEDAYGLKRKELVATVPKKNIPEDIDPQPGQQLSVQRPDGSFFNVMITEVDADNVVLDANHPLAGETLIFEVELLEIA